MILTAFTQIPSPNHNAGRKGVVVDTLVMHYTAGPGDEEAVARLFADPEREASAHFVVGRTGGVVQCVDTDHTAWHAGDHGVARIPRAEQIEACATGDVVPIGDVPRASRMLNRRSIGIEFCNAGWSTFGRNAYVEARHRNPACSKHIWESYTDRQIASGVALASALVKVHPTIKYLCGHEDATHMETIGDVTATPEVERKAGGKTDPGPLFRWQAFDGLGLVRVRYDFQRHGWERL